MPESDQPSFAHYSSFLRRHWPSLSAGLVGFVLAKSTQFIAPLLLLPALGVSEYGVFEFAIAIASVLSLILSAGAPGAIPYFLIKRKRPLYLEPIRAHMLLTGVILLLGPICYFSGWISLTFYLVLSIVGVTVVQTLYAVTHKVHGRLFKSSLFESGLYVVVLVLALFYRFLGHPIQIGMIAFWCNIYGLICIAAIVRDFPWRSRWRPIQQRYYQLLSFGAPLILTSGLFGLIAAGGRILAGKLLSMEDVGIYGFCFRLAGGVILVHQLLTTLFFRSFYAATHAKLDRYFSRFLAITFLVAMTGFLSAPLLLDRFLPNVGSLVHRNLAIYYVLSFQMVFWVGMSLCEMVTAREGLASKVLAIQGTGLTLLIGAALILRELGTLNLMSLSLTHMLVVFYCFFGQWLLLARNHTWLPRAGLVGAALAALYLLSSAFL